MVDLDWNLEPKRSKWPFKFVRETSLNEKAKACRTEGLECLGWLRSGREGIWGNDNLGELLVRKCRTCDFFQKFKQVMAKLNAQVVHGASFSLG